MKAKIHVMFRDGILDPQAQAVQKTLKTLGFNDVKRVRQGKYFEIVMEEMAKEKAHQQVDAMCHQLLVNNVIENYSFNIE